MKLMKLKLLVIAVIMFTASAASAALSNYSVTIDTSSLYGTTGALDFQFTPGNTTELATAAISGFTGGTLISNPAPQTSGVVSGTLPSTVTINNTTQYNDYFTNFTFGNSITFNLALSGAPSNSFRFSMFSDADGTVPVLTRDSVEGYAFMVDMNPGGNAITNNITSASTVAPVPIPPAILMLGSGLAGLGFLRRRFFRA